MSTEALGRGTVAEQPALLLPEGTRLLHIGPPKTGTTTIQGAFHEARERSLAQGVRYAGSSQHSAVAVLAGIGRPSFKDGEAPPSRRYWNALRKEVRGAREPRVVISSEFFADADADAIPRIVDELGGGLQVVLTLRPLGRILPSQWQQYVKSGLSLSYEGWLEGILNTPDKTTPLFWRRHRHHDLAAAWAAVVGPERLTVIVVDDRDHERVLRDFERLTGLRAGTLAAVDDFVNRSMTLPEAEALRAFTIAFRAEGFSNALLHKVMNFGTADYVKVRVPSQEEPRVQTPQWALDGIAPVTHEIVDGLRAGGYRIVGDLDALAVEEHSRLAGDRNPDVAIPPEIAARMAVGMLVVQGLERSPRAADLAAGGRAPGALPSDAPVHIEPPGIARLPTSRLLIFLAERALHALRRARHRLARNRPPAPGPRVPFEP